MMRIALAVVWGSILFAAGEAGACEAHAARAPEAAPVNPEARPEASARDAVPSERKGSSAGSDERHAAKCQCGSAADCTCKKGTCECAKCKKPGREEAPVKAEAEAAAPGEGGADV